MDRKDVYNFAVKWNEKFRDPDIDYIELVDHYLADDCSALGFEMDCGHAFEEKFKRAVYDARALDTIIENVNDISLLGSDIFQMEIFQSLGIRCSRDTFYAQQELVHYCS